jgi:methionyl aminopeptidase
MVEIKSQREIDMMKFPAEILVKTMNTLKDMIAPGVRTIDLDRKAAEVIKKNNGRAAFLGYGAPEKPFPASICASVNEQVVHGIPGNYELKEGDIIGIDLGVEKNGFYSDACYTFAVGKVSKEVKKLLTVTENSLYQGIDKFIEGNRLYDISNAIQRFVEKNGFSVVRDFVGHGIGRNLHEDPQIPNYGTPNRGLRLKQGMVFAIEPMINMGNYHVEVLDDGWTVVTKDRKYSAHFEHTVVLGKDGPEILTRFFE